MFAISLSILQGMGFGSDCLTRNMQLELSRHYSAPLCPCDRYHEKITQMLTSIYPSERNGLNSNKLCRKVIMNNCCLLAQGSPSLRKHHLGTSLYQSFLQQGQECLSQSLQKLFDISRVLVNNSQSNTECEVKSPEVLYLPLPNCDTGQNIQASSNLISLFVK